MKQKILNGIFFVFVCFIFLIQNKSLGATTTSDYIIKSYNINMIVNEDNTFDITENIIAYFNVPKHGIYRKIPLKNSISRTDGSKSSNNAKITDISVNENYTISNSNGYKIIKIGNANKTLTGQHSYTISYKYNIGKDPLKDADELYFNLIGNQWDTSISNVYFAITMPKSFDKSLLGFSSGGVGSTNSLNVTYSVNENTIKGSTIGTLKAGQGLTVRLTLPEGYFVGASSNIDTYSIVVIIISLACALISYRLWAKYGKDDEVIETVEFYPPEGYNSAEVGFLYEGFASRQSIISLLIYLANKGYLKIEETEEKEGTELSGNSKGFRITKLKEYDGNNENERIFFNGLFKRKKKTVDMDLATNTSSKTSVTASDLYNNFYLTLDKIENNLNSKKNKIFESVASGKVKWLIMMVILLIILITIKPMLEYGDKGAIIFALIFPCCGLSIIVEALTGNAKPKSIAIIIGGLFGGIPVAFLVFPALIQNSMYMVMYIVGIVCISVILLFAKIMPKRTPYGNEMLGKLRGFKRFLETAEKPQLESLVTQNPEYFYNILPYTYALGVSDVWISQFESIALKAPNWYDSSDDFDMHSFGTFMNTTMDSAIIAMSSSPSSDSGGSDGSSSGGGSSGGGSGGGGGGSW